MDFLGAERAAAVTAVSPSLAPEELDDCRALAGEWGLRWSTVETREMDDPAYVINDGDRCRSCKSALMDALVPFAAHGFAGRGGIMPRWAASSSPRCASSTAMRR